MLLHRSSLAASSGLRRAAGTVSIRQPPRLPFSDKSFPKQLNYTCVLFFAAVRRCTGNHAVARSSSMASSAGVAMLTSTAAASSNGRFAGSSTAELEEWLVGRCATLFILPDTQITRQPASTSATDQQTVSSIVALRLLDLADQRCVGVSRGLQPARGAVRQQSAAAKGNRNSQNRGARQVLHHRQLTHHPHSSPPL